MILTPEIIKRLSFIKYLFEFAREQSKLHPPQNFISVLMFHDSVELFLHLSAQYLDANLDNINFMKYFKRIDEKLGDQNLTQKAAMNTLNKERVSLKHYNLYPNPDNIEMHRVNTQNFFNENYPVVFEIEFSEISLLDLVQDDEVKKLLESAQNEFDEVGDKKSLELIALAFNTLLENYEENKKISYKSLFEIGEDLSYVEPFMLHWNNDDLRKISETVKDMQNFLKIIILNLDSKKYIRFRVLTPLIRRKANGQYYPIWAYKKSNKVFIDEFKFCMNFVIESALRLQEFDFEIDKYIKN